MVGVPPQLPWTPEPDEALQRDLDAALASEGASHVRPPRPVALATDDPDAKVVGWLWGRKRTEDGTWLGLATLFFGRAWEGSELGWHPAEKLRTLN